ncbi:hypothetical protein P153DRAFT_424744 [Dothidotthia symphoricarpi CBS 119687]|uniref:Uncharacterized protein n=1 Tax=Dothidotthia symphoricarpi CBS 119687 TaxID=1392245 RepID=A0A6A6A6T2_9PLEO|nr:uncharacterized protein P153DRAFT_424744 [Dothidotthia symphoricarpi CBS 119687]KAF2126774.1 hypothetical protein P153DRAFT_424744 [Dothidotthia symphoricarpi CBS 119687]
MASHYQGPASLAFSRYASPQQRSDQLAAFAAVSPISKSMKENVIATKDQIAASDNQPAPDMATQNSDAQLAVAQGNTLKKEVDTHAAKFSRSVSTAVTNTRQLLELIRDSLQKEDASELKTVDNLWNELEQLFAAAKEAKVVLPIFLEKQRNNMSLYHSSMMNETYRETQEELNIQHKKVNLQHNLILEHQQAFQDYKEQVAPKLQENEELRDRLSRLTLEKGNFRTEIDKYKQLLEQQQSCGTEDLKKADDLQKEVETLVTSSQRLMTENETLRDRINDMEEQKKTAEQTLADGYTEELRSKTELLAKEGVKTMSLNVLVNALKSGESNAKKEVDKVKAENKMLGEKYKNQAAEHATAFTKLSYQTKNIEGLTVELERLRKEKAELKASLAKLSELEETNTELSQAKSDLQKQVDKLTAEMGQAKDDGRKVENEYKVLLEKVKKLEKENEDLEIENNNFEADHKKALQALTVSQKENSKLVSTVNGLKTNRSAVAPAVGGILTAGKETKALEEKVRGLEEQKTTLEDALEEWTTLAKRSYKEYKEMLPTYKLADNFRKDALEKQEQIKALKLQLASAKVSQLNGGGASGDAGYWKDKYERLLSTYGN